MNFMEICIEKGIKTGESLKLLSQIRKKYERGYSSVEIAAALEEPEEYILKILDALKAHPDWTDEQIVNKMK